MMDLQHFSVSNDLMLLEPRIWKGQRCTLVHEQKRKYVVLASVKRVISRACALYGTSVTASTALSKEITKGTKKLPIGLGTKNPLILIPTSSPSNGHTQWVVYDAIQNYTPTLYNDCIVHFVNGESLTLGLSYHSLRTQLSHAHALSKYFHKLSVEQLCDLQASLFFGEVSMDALLPVN